MMVALLLATWLSSAEVGQVRCVARGAVDNEHHGSVVCRGANGSSLHVRLPGKVVQVRVTEVLGAPSIAAVGRYYSGDDEWAESTVIGIVDGNPRDLWPAHWVTGGADDVSGARLNTGQPGVWGLAFVWDMRHEAHVDAHRYRMTEYPWAGGQFRPRRVRYTQRRYRDWPEAAAELGVSCPEAIGQARDD